LSGTGAPAPPPDAAFGGNNLAALFYRLVPTPGKVCFGPLAAFADPSLFVYELYLDYLFGKGGCAAAGFSASGLIYSAALGVGFY